MQEERGAHYGASVMSDTEHNTRNYNLEKFDLDRVLECPECLRGGPGPTRSSFGRDGPGDVSGGHRRRCGRRGGDTRDTRDTGIVAAVVGGGKPGDGREDGTGTAPAPPGHSPSSARGK